MKLILVIGLLLGSSPFSYAEHEGPSSEKRQEMNETACTYYLIGNKERLKGEVLDFSLGGEKALVQTSINTVSIFDAVTGKYSEPMDVGTFYSGQLTLSPDGNHVLLKSMTGAKIADLKQNKIIVDTNYFMKEAAFSRDGKLAAIANYDAVQIIDLATKKAMTIETSLPRGYFYGVELSPNGSHLLRGDSYGHVRIWDVNTGKEIYSYPQSSERIYFYSAFFSPNGRWLAIHTSNGIEIVSMESKKKIADIPADHDKPVFRDDTILGVKDERPFAFDLIEGRITQSFPRAGNRSFSPDGQSVLTGEYPPRVFNTTSGKEIWSLPNISKHAYMILANNNKAYLELRGRTSIVRFDPICASAHSTKSSIPSDRINIEKPENKAFCKGDFVPKLSSDKEPALVSTIWEWQKPGGLNLKRDLPLLLGVLENREFVKNNPELVHGILINVFGTSYLLYDRLLKDYPYLAELRPEKLWHCLNEKEVENVAPEIVAHVRENSDRAGGTKTPVVKYLSPLAPILASLPPSEKDPLLHDLTLSLTHSVGDSEAGNGIFESKVYKLLKQKTRVLFGEKPDSLTDINLVRTPDGFDVVAIGTDKLEGMGQDTQDLHGLQLKKLGKIALDSLEATSKTSHEFQWKHAGKQWKARIDLEKEKQQDLVTDSDSPPYETFNKDGLRGMILVGASMDDPRGQLDAVRNLYENRGYKFVILPEMVRVKDHLVKEVENGKLDYLQKEAHSDGDEQNLFRTHSLAQVYQGVKKGENGKPDEVVEILYPDTKSNSELIPNKEFGGAVRKRESPLLYFNTSCWSTRKAVYEIPFAGKNLIEIASDTINTNLRRGKATGNLLEAFLDNKDYKGMREAMGKDNEHKSSKKNNFLFPNDSQYHRLITRLVKEPVPTYQLIDENGRIQTLEAQGSH